MLNKKKKPYSETQIYRDATICMQNLIKTIIQTPKTIQYSIGESLLKDMLRIAQLMKLCYEAKPKYKLMYADEAKERLQCLEVGVNQLYECRFINEDKLSNLYSEIGSMEKQLRGWMEKMKKDISKDSNDDNDNINIEE